MDVDPDEQSYPLVLARNVKNFAVECLDTNKGWVTEWDDTNSIPPQLRYTLVLGGNDDFRGAAPTLGITNVVKMRSSTLPAVVQMPRGGGGGGGGGLNLNIPGGSSPNGPGGSSGGKNPNNPNNPNPFGPRPGGKR